MKKNHLFRCGILASISTMLFSCNLNKAHQYAFMFKLTGNHYGEVLYKGFSKTMAANNKVCFDKSPSEANVGDQIQMIETLILQNVDAITVSAAGTTGYDNVLKQAHDKNIKVVSVDSPISPKYRLTHIDHCDPKTVGRWLAHAAILISQDIKYPVEWFKTHAAASGFEEFMEEKLKEEGFFKKGKRKFGFISSTQDSPSQNEWIKYCSEELKTAKFANLVDTSTEFEVKYGNDEPIESKAQANAFIETNSVNVIIAPTTVAMLAAGQALKQSSDNKGIKLTGLGMPSEMYDYMPKEGEEEFNAVCPYMCMWRVDLFGEIAAAATLAAVEGTFDGTVGSQFEYTYEEEGVSKKQTFRAIKSDDGGTKVVSLTPYAFHKSNIAEWKDKF